ncbi:MAG TPA: serine hydrolase [Longimicrobiales bacterium]
MRNALGHRLALPALALGLLLPAPVAGQPELEELDAYIEQAMRDWGIAGMSVAIVKDGRTIYARGFGVRDVTKGEPVDEHTLFAIGSNTKLFTAVAIGMLVDAGKMEWDGRIIDYLPWFRLYDRYATRELTVRDALSHRSGLGRRGDALWYGTPYSREEVIRRVRYLEPNSSFRSQFGYQNIMFLTAGEALAAVAGTSWDAFIDERIFAPLGMDRSNTSVKSLARMTNVAQPHEATPDGPKPIPWRDIDNVGPAGSINSSAAEMAHWLKFLLAWGEYDGRRLIEEETLRTIMSPHTIVEKNPSDTLAPSRHFSAYGLGVLLSDYKGHKIQSHTGGIDGMLSNVTTIPEKNVGWVILTNTSYNGLYTALSNYLLDTFLGGDRKDWNAIALARWKEQRARAEAARARLEEQRARGTRPSLALEKYAGVYTDSMYGDLRIVHGPAGLRLSWGPYQDVPLEHWHYDTFTAEGSGLGDGRTFVTFRLNARAEVAAVEVSGLEDFERQRERPTRTAAGRSQ